ncbi:hypothetical protein LSAT2_000185 [Lamellibrachia satsuma]|nr:hypothetical protein LSAT2_000185 [Lamellibrachia satsuma]
MMPFYVDVSSPQPKDLVVVVDTSGSMRITHQGRSLMQIAIEAASTVVDTLGPNDRVGVVSFSATGSVSTSACYADSLHGDAEKQTIPHPFIFAEFEGRRNNKLWIGIKESLRILHDHGGQCDHGRPRQNKLILFLTDGEPTDNEETIMQTLRDEKAKLGNKVVMFTFGFGEAFSSYAKLRSPPRSQYQKTRKHYSSVTTFALVAPDLQIELNQEWHFLFHTKIILDLFTPTAFDDPYEHLGTEETGTTVDRYELYLAGNANPVNPCFKERVRESVASSLQIDSILSSRPATPSGGTLEPRQASSAYILALAW